MDDIKKSQFFILVGLKKIILTALNKDNQILLNKKLSLNDKDLNENLGSLKKFLDQNIIDTEKRLNTYIEEINLIIDYHDFISIDVSTIYNFSNKSKQSDNTSSYLLNIKNEVLKSMANYDLVHMLITKFIVDGKDFLSISNINEHKNIFLEIKFICLKNNILQDFKETFSKYEISINKVFDHSYVNSFREPNLDNIFDLADKLKKGHNQKEILLVEKPLKDVGFFNKFFNFFN